MNHVPNELIESAPNPPFLTKARHPVCINFLLRHGVPDDMDEKRALSVLIRYGAARGLDEKHVERMVETIMHNTLRLSTTKAKQSYLGAQIFLTKQKNRRVSGWHCTEVLASKRLRERDTCSGWQCEYYNQDEHAASYPQSVADEVRREQALITYVFNNPESAAEGAQLKLGSESFVGVYICKDGAPFLLNRALWHVCCHLALRGKEIRTGTVLELFSRHSEMRPYVSEITSYVQDIATRTPCEHGIFLENLLQVKERGIEQHVQALVYAASLALRSHALPLDVILHALEDQLHALSLTGGNTICKFDDDLPHLVETFFASEHHATPTASSWVNAALEGGWKPGSIYAVYASRAAEATDFAAWCIDQAAWHGHPTLYVSYGESRDRIGLEALTRHSGVETNDLSMQRGHIYDSAEGKAMLERIISGGERLSKRIAQHIWTLEADEQTTIADIMRAVRSVQHRDSLGHNKAALLLIDHLPTKVPCKKSTTSGVGKRGPSEERALVVGLKRSIRKAQVATVVFFVPRLAGSEERPKGNPTEYAASLARLTKHSAADYTLTLHSYNVEIEGLDGRTSVDQLEIAREWYKCRYPEYSEYIQGRFDALRDEYRMEATCHYTRASLYNKAGSVQSNPLILYEPSSHRFRSLDIEPMNFEETIRTPPKTHDHGTLTSCL